MAEVQDVRAATDEVGRSKVCSNFDNLQKVLGKAFEGARFAIKILSDSTTLKSFLLSRLLLRSPRGP